MILSINNSKYFYKQIQISIKGSFQRFYRETTAFQNRLNLLEKLDNETENTRSEYQLQALKKVMKHAGRHIPHWRQVFSDYGVDPNNITSAEDLTRLPFLTKKDILANIERFVSRKHFKWILPTGLTSGTTGSPALFYRDMNSVIFENAILWNIRKKSGMQPGCRLAWLRGDLIISSSHRTPPFWIRNYGTNQLIISSYHLIPEFKSDIINAIAHFKPSGAFAYPSSAYVLAKWCKELDRELPFVNLHTSSETVLADQRATINAYLPGSWVDHYGQAERVNFFASTNGDHYREYSEYAVTEMLPLENGNYEIIGSTLHNYAMPLFRYRTGDVVEGRNQDGNNRPVIKGLLGRKEDFVILPDGTILGRLDLIFKGLENIVESQIYQPVLDKIVLRVVPSGKFSSDDENKLLKQTRERIGQNISFDVEYHKEIPRSKAGKFKFVVSDVAQKNSV